jgi:5,10-methylenetetrahydromethanopterin reductase
MRNATFIAVRIGHREAIMHWKPEGEESMLERLAVGIIPGTGWRANEIQDVARAAEDAGFEAIFCTEVNNDSVGTAQLMGLATRHIKVGTWVADIYLRAPYLCAKSAIITADATDGPWARG